MRRIVAAALLHGTRVRGGYVIGPPRTPRVGAGIYMGDDYAHIATIVFDAESAGVWRGSEHVAWLAPGAA